VQDAVLLAFLAPLAFIAALCTGVVMAWMVQTGWRRPGLLLPATVFPLLCLFALTSVTLLGGATTMDGSGDGRHWSVALLSKVVSLLLMGAALERILFSLSRPTHVTRARLIMLLAFTAFWCSNVLSPMIFGAHRLVSHEYVYSLVLGWAALMATSDDGDLMIRCCRDGVLGFLVAGLLVLPVLPQLVLSDIGPALLPWPATRYSGLAGHPNQLGPFAMLFLMCLWHTPFNRRGLTWFGWSIGIVSLLLAGSKTTLLAFVPVAGAVLIARYGRMTPLLWRDPRYSKVLGMLVVLGMLMAVAACALLLAMDPDRIEAWLRGNSGAATVTVTGRDIIWRAALQEWDRYPYFGYGLSLWDAAFRTKVHAYHAHNQLLQTLAVAGLVGGVGLMTWIVALGTMAVRSATATRGLSVGLFTMLLVRGMTEVPLPLAGYGTELMMHLLLIMTVASSLPEGKPSSKARPLPIYRLAR
jgi:exopolysaccharide production protein ExoQ